MTNSEDWHVEPSGALSRFWHDCLTAAGAAPSVHNTQPWRFRITDNAVDVLADRSRHLDFADPAGRELLISVGAAIANLRIACWTPDAGHSFACGPTRRHGISSLGLPSGRPSRSIKRLVRWTLPSRFVAPIDSPSTTHHCPMR